MPIKKQIAMVASRMKMSMISLSLERSGFRMMRDRIGRQSQEDPLDNEEQKARPADRDRQIGDADRQERKIGDGVVPGHLDQPLAPDDHEGRDQRHQELDNKVEPSPPRLGKLVGEI